MFDTLLITTLFLLASLLARLLTLRLSINIKHLCLFFHSLLIWCFFRPPPSLFILTPSFIKVNENLRGNIIFRIQKIKKFCQNEIKRFGNLTKIRFYVLAQFLFTTSETELDYYHKKVNVRLASRVVKQLMT